MIDAADKVAIFGGDGCRNGREEVLALAAKLQAPVGYSFRGKQWLEHDNPNAVGMTGLLGYGGAYRAIDDADLVLLLGTDFPFPEFLPGDSVQKVQIDTNAKHIGRRTAVDLGLVGDIQSTIAALLPMVRKKTDKRFLDDQITKTESFDELLNHYVEKGPEMKPIRPEFLAATLSELRGRRCDVLRRYRHGVHVGSAAHPRRTQSPDLRLILLGVDGERLAQRVWCAAGVPRTSDDRAVRQWWVHDARPRRLADTSPAQDARAQHLLNNECLDFVNIEMQEAGIKPFGTGFENPNFAKVAEAMGAKGIRLEDPGDVREALAEALAYRAGPVVVDAVVDPFALSLPSHIPFHAVKGFTLSMAKQILSGKMDEVVRTIEHNVRLV